MVPVVIHMNFDPGRGSGKVRVVTWQWSVPSHAVPVVGDHLTLRYQSSESSRYEECLVRVQQRTISLRPAGGRNTTENTAIIKLQVQSVTSLPSSWSPVDQTVK